MPKPLLAYVQDLYLEPGQEYVLLEAKGRGKINYILVASTTYYADQVHLLLYVDDKVIDLWPERVDKILLATPESNLPCRLYYKDFSKTLFGMYISSIAFSKYVKITLKNYHKRDTYYVKAAFINCTLEEAKSNIVTTQSFTKNILFTGLVAGAVASIVALAISRR